MDDNHYRTQIRSDGSGYGKTSRQHSFYVRMVDCVAYMVKNAIGHMENDLPRMVNTPLIILPWESL